MRFVLGIEYDGSRFLGWQRLAHGPTLQGEVEAALSFVADESIEVTCSGRTDAGVHALCQVVHFDSDIDRTPYAWMQGGNSRLPHGITIRWAQPVAGDFSARFSARARRYRYRILNRATRPALAKDFLSWVRAPLDAEAMHRAGQQLLGENDFSAFRTVQCQAPHARRDLQELRVQRSGDEVVVEVQANAFLHHMVRNIVGSLLLVGQGERSEAWIAEVLAGGDRTLAGPTAPAQGLLFLGPRYPREWGLPEEVCLPEASP